MTNKESETIEYTERFSRKNPPGSKEEALGAIDEIEEDISSIESQLEFKSAPDFSDTEVYQGWKSRAIAALGHSRNEVRFLHKWLAVGDAGVEMGLPSIENMTLSLKPKLTGITHRMFRQDVQNRARISARILSAEIENVDFPSIQERQIFLRQILLRVEQSFTDIDVAGSNAQMTNGQIKDAKLPLVQFKQKLSLELSSIKTRLTQQSSPDWRSVCAAALRRVESQGFLLTPEEIEVLSDIELRLE